MITKITEKLDKERISDYEVAPKAPNDVISIYPDPGKVKIYIPEEFEYSQYGIDDFIRSMIPSARTSISSERDMYVMTLSSGRMNENQLYKLVKYIIEENEFCSIIEDEK